MTRHVTRTIATLCWAVFIHSIAIARSPDSVTSEFPLLFRDAVAREDALARSDAPVLRSRAARLDLDLLGPDTLASGDPLVLNLFDDVSIRAEFASVDVKSRQRYVWTARITNDPFGYAVFVVRQGRVTGSIRATGVGLFQIRSIGDGIYAIRELDEGAYAPCATAPVTPPLDRPVRRGAVCVDDGSVIDVMVVYTAAARDAVIAAGSDMESLIDLAVATSNISYENSLIETQLNLVHTAETAYDETGNNLYLLRDSDDGVMDEVHGLRDQYNADLVALVVEWPPGYCGRAFLLKTDSLASESLGFSVTRRRCMENLTFAHELGHNMGCSHDRANEGINTRVFDYCYGYQDVGGAFRTIMSYDGEPNCIEGCLRVPFFSNPDLEYLGAPLGVPIDQPDSAHNALCVNNTKLTIANYRPSVPVDCNENGVADSEEIADGTGADVNENDILDECETTLHVDGDARPGGDGLSWETAYNHLQDALAMVGEGGSCDSLPVVGIRVADGTYRPDQGVNQIAGDRAATFRLLVDIKIEGGYAGYGAANPDERDPILHETILSGDLEENDGPDFANNEDNSLHVVYGKWIHRTSVLDGFTITAGNANGTYPDDSGGGMIVRISDDSPTVINCTFRENYALDRGGAIYDTYPGVHLTRCRFIGNRASYGGALNSGGRSSVSDCEFLGNWAEMAGGGAACVGGLNGPHATFTNCLFTGNNASWGGGMSIGAIYPADVTLINCTFSRNTAQEGGGGIDNYNGDGRFSGCILWGNEDRHGTTASSQIWVETGDPCVEFSDVQGCWTGTCGTGNSCSDPLFVDADGPDGIPGTPDDNLRLLAESPCIDAADNSVVNAAFDLDANERIVDGDEDGTTTVDMGAYEFFPPPPPIPALSPLGVAAMGVVLLVAGAAVLSRRRRVSRVAG